jgi:hypothetical protein
MFKSNRTQDLTEYYKNTDIISVRANKDGLQYCLFQEGIGYKILNEGRYKIGEVLHFRIKKDKPKLMEARAIDAANHILNGEQPCQICGKPIKTEKIECEHDWQAEWYPVVEVTSNSSQKKWRCTKCLLVRYTYD